MLFNRVHYRKAFLSRLTDRIDCIPWPFLSLRTYSSSVVRDSSHRCAVDKFLVQLGVR